MKVFRIPLYTFAQAGPAQDFLVIPSDWDEWVETTINPIQRKGAFAIQIRGDSLSPVAENGDIVIAQQGLYPGPRDYVVAYIEDEGAVFKRLEYVGGDPENGARLVSMNPDYPSKVYRRDKLIWMWRVIKIEKIL